MKPELSAKPNVEKEAKVESSPIKDSSLQDKDEIANGSNAQVDQDQDVNGYKQLAQEKKDENMQEESKADDNGHPAAKAKTYLIEEEKK